MIDRDDLLTYPVYAELRRQFYGAGFWGKLWATCLRSLFAPHQHARISAAFMMAEHAHHTMILMDAAIKARTGEVPDRRE